MARIGEPKRCVVARPRPSSAPIASSVIGASPLVRTIGAGTPNSAAMADEIESKVGICVDQSAGSSKYELRRFSERCARPSWSLANFEISSSLALVRSSTARERTVAS